MYPVRTCRYTLRYCLLVVCSVFCLAGCHRFPEVENPSFVRLNGQTYAVMLVTIDAIDFELPDGTELDQQRLLMPIAVPNDLSPKEREVYLNGVEQRFSPQFGGISLGGSLSDERYNELYEQGFSDMDSLMAEIRESVARQFRLSTDSPDEGETR